MHCTVLVWAGGFHLKDPRPKGQKATLRTHPLKFYGHRTNHFSKTPENLEVFLLGSHDNVIVFNEDHRHSYSWCLAQEV